MRSRNLGASVRARLLALARTRGQAFELVLVRYAIERLLFRLSESPHGERFVLKGALLFELWFELSHRATRDVDLLGTGSAAIPDVVTLFREVCLVEAVDGIDFNPRSVRGRPIGEPTNYPGVRVSIEGALSGARIPVQVDVGFGDAVVPEPQLESWPVILPEFDPPRLLVYPRYAVIAEKLHAIVVLGAANSRMKDFFDLSVMAQHMELDGEHLRAALRATFDRRQTKLPVETPSGLASSFATGSQQLELWNAFLGRNELKSTDLGAALQLLRDFLLPACRAAATAEPFHRQWVPGGGWR